MEACVLTKIIFIIIKFAKITKLDFVVLNNPNHNGVNGAHGENVQYHVVEVIDNLVFRNKYFLGQPMTTGRLKADPGWLFKKTAIWRCEIVMESDTVSYLKVSRGYKVLSMILDLHVHFP